MTGDVKLAAFDMGGVMITADESVPIGALANLSGCTREEVFASVFAPEKKALVETNRITWSAHAANVIAELKLTINEPELRRIHCSSHSPNPDVLRVVESVSRLLPVTIASNLPEPHWEWAQANLKVCSFFERPGLSYRIGVMKPQRGFFEALVSSYGLRPEEVFFTDDVEANVEGARAAGIPAYHFTTIEQLLNDLKDCGIPVRP